MFFYLVIRGAYPPYTLSSPTTKKKNVCVSSLKEKLLIRILKKVLRDAHENLLYNLIYIFQPPRRDLQPAPNKYTAPPGIL